jgi:S-adenosylmethionine decarboxylase proenzyme
MAIHGTHLLIDFYGCDSVLLNDPTRLEWILVRAAQLAGAGVLQGLFHRFEPGGVTGVLLLSESHLAIHTWPDQAFAAADLFTCGAADPHRAVEFLKEGLKAAKAVVNQQARGSGKP